MEHFIYTFLKGYYDAGDIAEAPDGTFISPSSNVILTKRGIPMSVKAPTVVSNTSGEGGSRAFVLDDALIGFMGNNSTTEKAVGNMILGSNRDLWFVGNSIANGVRVSNNFSSFMQIGGTRQVETMTISLGGVVGAGTITVTTTGAYITGSPIATVVTVAGSATANEVAQAIVDELRGESAILAEYFIYRDGADVILKDRTERANDGTLNMALALGTATNINTVANSSNTTAGAVDYIANLSATPQLAKYNGSGWNTPVDVGLAPQSDAMQLELTTNATMGAGFTGQITGSVSGRLARSRNGSVSIASGLSNVVTGAGNSMYVTIPVWAEDYSDPEDRIWLLYFTYSGRGSQSSHFLFPIEIPDKYLSGLEANGWESTVGSNCRVRVISQSFTTQADRKIEVEFLNNDLLLINPEESFYPLDSCKFLSPIGNVMCAIGTGVDQTGFDVSYPNHREAYTPDWRDWFKEVPVSVASSAEFGIIWVLGTYSTYQAIWTGATQQTAPVVLKEVSSKYGCIGEGASIAIHGILYAVSKGGIPIRIDPNGNVDDTFGNNVLNFFSTCTTGTQIGYDEKTNTVFFFNTASDKFIGYQIDTGSWTSPIDPTHSNNIDATFSLDGFMHYCYYDSGAGYYQTAKFNSDSGTNSNWVLASSFKAGQFGFNLKDVIELRAIVKSETADTITFTGVKNYDTSNTDSLFSQTTTASTRITYRRLVESLDYECVGIKASGSKYGQIIHAIDVIVDNHAIERGK